MVVSMGYPVGSTMILARMGIVGVGVAIMIDRGKRP